MLSTHLKGIISMLAAVALFACMDASMKQLSSAYPPLQVSCLRGLASIPFFLVVVAWSGRWRDLMPVRWAQHLARGAIAVVMLTAFVYSLTLLPLADAYAIFLSAPLWVTALSVLLLHESVGWHRWLAIVLGMLGVVVILRPEVPGAMTWGAVAALVSAVGYALGVIMIRTLTRTDTTLSIAFSFIVVIAVVTGVIAVPRWVPIQNAHWPWIVVLGVCGALAQVLIIEAFRHAPASLIAPFEYTALLWAILLDWLLWSARPNPRMLVGGAIVIVGGLYMIYREQRAPAKVAVG